nr:MAG TPA: hypothetical protein [Caudoviricetes sp.]
MLRRLSLKICYFLFLFFVTLITFLLWLATHQF